MKNRDRQRENRKRTYEKPWLNSEGYHDPTACLALRNIERDIRKPKITKT